MKAMSTRILITMGAAMLLLALGQSEASAQSGKSSEDPVRFDRMNLSGPRFGVTYVTGSGELWQRMD